MGVVTLDRNISSFELSDNTVDPSGSSYLLISFGQNESETHARALLADAMNHGPVQWLTFASFSPVSRRPIEGALRSCRNGVRIAIIGNQFDVLQCAALARSLGALENEIRKLITESSDLPIYCAHCRQTSRVVGTPGSVVVCSACARSVEIHAHFSESKGCFLASDARARTLP